LMNMYIYQTCNKLSLKIINIKFGRGGTIINTFKKKNKSRIKEIEKEIRRIKEVKEEIRRIEEEEEEEAVGKTD